MWGKDFSFDGHMDTEEETTGVKLLKVTPGQRIVTMVQITAEENQEAESRKKCTVTKQNVKISINSDKTPDKTSP